MRFPCGVHCAFNRGSDFRFWQACLDASIDKHEFKLGVGHSARLFFEGGEHSSVQFFVSCAWCGVDDGFQMRLDGFFGEFGMVGLCWWLCWFGARYTGKESLYGGQGEWLFDWMFESVGDEADFIAMQSDRIVSGKANVACFFAFEKPCVWLRLGICQIMFCAFFFYLPPCMR